MFSLLNTVKNGEFNPRLDKEQTLTVLDLKNNLRNKEHRDLANEVQEFRNTLEEDCNNLFLPSLATEAKREVFRKVNLMLLNLRR